MALGVELNSIAPNLIRDSGQALVQGIRQIGQQLSSHLTEIQTRRDLAAMAQGMQGLNVQSNDFPVQLAGFVGQHPLAARDERGQMLLSTLGKAHAQWQAGEEEARAFNRAMAMQGARDRAARDLFDYKTKVESQTPQNVGGALVIPNDPVTGQPNVLLPAPSRAGSNRPMVLNQGDVLVDPTGKRLAENPKSALPSASETRLSKKARIDTLLKQDIQLQREISDRIKRRDELSKQRMETSKAEDIAYLDNTVRAIESETAELRDRRLKLQKDIEAIELTPAAAEEPETLGLPPVAPNATAPAADAEMILVFDPNGRPGRIKASQLEAALANGYKRR